MILITNPSLSCDFDMLKSKVFLPSHYFFLYFCEFPAHSAKFPVFWARPLERGREV